MGDVKNNVTIEAAKCIVSGCECAARGTLKHGDIGISFEVCGIHRAELSTLLNKAAEPIGVARRLATVELIEGLHNMGDHSAEASLALAT